ncbi:hypothetical protein NC652_029698 [Populus alba x Populus x berolinensis]|uniref:Uncharacterized protein n=1 Tax=Populus alba x Populus x berolinensis TaxID=444605 RepID=A0AAD6M2C2_9ROSI|nr:hypothetical protein NC651_028751 [Populus alba x Populus x berolinensis]KAJ6888685.1 hypothetical protein NC652_029698 [Populus alba x Populus x berolinensis]KAJ6977490.1 hypothetical protein NC653_029408 [Populus alba x Populus x berolinensis]
MDLDLDLDLFFKHPIPSFHLSLTVEEGILLRHVLLVQLAVSDYSESFRRIMQTLLSFCGFSWLY